MRHVGAFPTQTHTHTHTRTHTHTCMCIHTYTCKHTHTHTPLHHHTLWTRLRRNAATIVKQHQIGSHSLKRLKSSTLKLSGLILIIQCHLCCWAITMQCHLCLKIVLSIILCKCVCERWDGNLHGLSMSCTMTASPKQSSTAHWRASNAMVGRGNAEWKTSKSGHPCPS